MKYEPGVLLSAAYYYGRRKEMIPTVLNPYAQGGNQSDLNGSDNLTEYDIKTWYIQWTMHYCGQHVHDQ